MDPLNMDPLMDPLNMERPSLPAPGSRDMIVLDVMAFVARLVRGRWRIVLCALIGLVLSVAFALSLHKSYTAEAMFLPPMSPESLQSASSLLLRQDPSDLYIGMLSSRSVADSVIDANGLMKVYHARYRAQARALLAGQSKFNIEQNALISIKITTGDPRLSANIANAYLNALYALNGQMSASSSAHRSQFFESQVTAEGDALANAEVQLQQMEEKTGTILPENEAQAGLSATARLQASIQDAEANLSSLLTGSTEKNPQVVRQRALIASLQAELRHQQLSGQGARGQGLPSTASMPGLMLDYLRRSRELKQRETLYDSLTAQYEKARLASLDPGPQLQIVDRAVPPERKSGPPRTNIVILGTFLGGAFGILSLILPAPLKRLREIYVIAASRPDRR